VEGSWGLGWREEGHAGGGYAAAAAQAAESPDASWESRSEVSEFPKPRFSEFQS
jgi:hypothetical protein